MLLTASLLALAGLLLTLHGLRGRQADDHPLCRRCGFDLFGTPDGVSVCSECGADLKAKRAVRVGHRARRRGPLVAGTLLLLPSLAALGGLLWVRARHVDWIRYKPAAWLVSDLHAAAPVRDAALVELWQRFDAHELPAARADQVSDVALAIQGDPSKPWATQWGNWLEHAHDGGMLSDERWARYLRQAFNLTLDVRPYVRRGDPLVYRLAAQRLRVGSLTIWGAWEPRVRVRLSGHEFDFGYARKDDWDFKWPRTTPASLVTRLPLKPQLLAQLADGPQTLQIDLAGPCRAPLHYKNETIEQPKHVTLRGSWTLVPADQSTVQAIHRPDLAPAMRSAVQVDVRFDGGDWACGTLSVADPPAPLAYQVYWRAGQRKWKSVGPDVTTAPGGVEKHPLLFHLPGDASSVDFLLLPDPQIAARTLGATTYWDGRIVLENVPVRRQ